VAVLVSAAVLYGGNPVAPGAYGFVAFGKGIGLTPGTTLFSSSEIATPPYGYATIFLTEARTRVEVYGDSNVKFAGSSEEPVIKLASGALRLAVEGGRSGAQVLVLGATVRLEGNALREAEVRLIAPNRLSVAAITCPVVVEAGAETLTVPKGSLYHFVVADPAPQGPPQGTGGPPAVRRRALWIISGVAIGVATAVGIYLSNRGHGAPSGVFLSPAVP